MTWKRVKKKHTLYLIVLLFLISAGASITLLNKSQTLLSWDERSTGRAIVQLIILQQSYLTILEQYQRGEIEYAKVLNHYDLTWSAYETVINGTKNAHFMGVPRRTAKLKNHFKNFQDTDPMVTRLSGDRLIYVLEITHQAHNYVVELLHYEYQGDSQQRQSRNIVLVQFNRYIAVSLFGVSLSATLFLLIIFGDKRRMAYLAYHDALTKLNNRIALEEKITRLQMTKVDFCALLIDIDGFKLINDNYGHDIGDQLLVHITQKMSDICQKESFLARLGGDEFAVIHLSANEAESIASKLLEITKNPILIHGHHCHVGLSIGISCALPIHKKWVDVLKDADQAMYQAKQKGGSQYQIYALG